MILLLLDTQCASPWSLRNTSDFFRGFAMSRDFPKLKTDGCDVDKDPGFGCFFDTFFLTTAVDLDDDDGEDDFL